MDALDAQLQDLLGPYKSYFSLQGDGKIKCEMNGHTLPARLDTVSAFIKGAKFQKLVKRHQAEDILRKYEPFIVQSKNFPLMLYCALTGQLMDKSVEAVKKHMQGKRFKRAKERFTNDEVDLRPEPSLESFGIKQPKDQLQQQGKGSGLQPQQEQQHKENRSNQQQEQQQPLQANGSAVIAAAVAGGDDDAGSDEEPAFWMPDESDELSGGDEPAGTSDDSKAAAAAAGSSDDGMDEDVEAGPSTAADPMEEDIPTSKPAVTAEAAAVTKKKHRKAAGGCISSKPQQIEATAANGAGVSGGKKKKNISRPNHAKKAKH